MQFYSDGVCLGMLTCEHELVGIVRNGENMWWDLLSFLATVASYHLWIVDWKPFVGIHSHTEQSRIGLQEDEGLLELFDLNNKGSKIPKIST